MTLAAECYRFALRTVAASDEPARTRVPRPRGHALHSGVGQGIESFWISDGNPSSVSTFRKFGDVRVRTSHCTGSEVSLTEK